MNEQLEKSEYRQNALGRHPILDYIAHLKRGQGVAWAGTEMGQGLEGIAAKFFMDHPIPTDGERLGFETGRNEENHWANGRILLDTIKTYTDSARRQLEQKIPRELIPKIDDVLNSKNPNPNLYLSLSEQLIASFREMRGFEVIGKIPDFSDYIVDTTTVETLNARLTTALQKK